MKGYQDIRFTSIIDDPKYKSGAEYEIDFNLNTEGFFTQTNKGSGYERNVKMSKNPNFGKQQEREFLKKKEELEKLGSLKEKSTFIGLKEDVEKSLDRLAILIKKKITHKEIEILNLDLKKITEICAPFCVGVENQGQKFILKGSTEQSKKKNFFFFKSYIFFKKKFKKHSWILLFVPFHLSVRAASSNIHHIGKKYPRMKTLNWLRSRKGVNIGKE